MALTVGIDGDDTLWENEPVFARAYARFDEVVSEHSNQPVREALLATERRNLEAFGYGVKSFTLSMIEAAIEVTDGTVPTSAIAALIETCREMLAAEVKLMPGVAEALPAMAERWRLVLVTKGDLLHQESKLAQSGLLPYFSRVAIVSEKDPATYLRVLEDVGASPAEFVMVGDSRRSDVDAVLQIGGRAIHIPNALEWEHEAAEIDAAFADRWHAVPSLREVPAILDRFAAAP